MRKFSTMTPAQKATMKPATLLQSGDLVVIDSKDKQRCVVKLKESSTNALNWFIWSFEVLSGNPKNPGLNLNLNQFDIVEVVLPMVGLEDDSRHKWMARVEEVSRPWHVYVEVTAGCNAYVIYKFARVELAENVKACAVRFGLAAFVLDTTDDGKELAHTPVTQEAPELVES